MNGVVGGFAALTAVIAVGWLVARTGTLGRDAAAVLSKLSYVVATPALLLLTCISRTRRLLRAFRRPARA